MCENASGDAHSSVSIVLLKEAWHTYVSVGCRNGHKGRHFWWWRTFGFHKNL